MLNETILIGRLTQDIELKEKESFSVCNFSLAVRRSFKNANNEYDSDFIDCVAYNKTSELMAEYCKKGSLIAVRGRLQKRSYDAQDGTKRYVTEVVVEKMAFLQSKPKEENTFDEYDLSKDGVEQIIDDSSLPF